MKHIAIFLLLANGIALANPPEHTHERAGTCNGVAWYAVCGRSPKQAGGSIGGGALHKGMAPPDDGTWGWDTVGHRRYGQIFLGWSYAKQRTPPTGPYKVDGPHVPDIFAVKPIKRAIEKHGEE